LLKVGRGIVCSLKHFVCQILTQGACFWGATGAPAEAWAITPEQVVTQDLASYKLGTAQARLSNDVNIVQLCTQHSDSQAQEYTLSKDM
jgi:hypothetical protein